MMIKSIKSTSFFLMFTLGLSANAFSGNAELGEIYNLHFMSNGVVIVYTRGIRTNVPPCALNQPARFAVDGKSAGGKVQLSGLLTAYSLGQKVRFIGANNCNAYSDTETANYIVVNQK